jgi:hypothetical protein
MRWKAAVTSLGCLLLVPSAALAAGGPVPPVQGGSGIAAPGATVRFIASRAGSATVIKRVTTHPLHVQAAIRVPGRYGIPGAAYDGTLTGLSANGGTLILAQVPTFYPVRTTRLLVLDTRRMRIVRRIVLPGWSGVDAISPDGRWMFLIHYSASNVLHYEVLAYDLPHGRLLAKPIVDPKDRGEAMTGFPLNRVMSPGGRWAYTLYSRPSGVPFIHALDTAGLRAVCIDLPSLRGLGFGAGTPTLVLAPRAATLEVKIGDWVAARINTRRFAVNTVWRSSSATSDPREAQSTRPAGGGGGGGLPWELTFVPLAAAAALGTAVWWHGKARARQGSPQPDPRAI